jgi:hypothetical protein
MNAATSLVGGIALALRSPGFERRDMSASYAATRERYMRV